jgi:pyruvate/2-oxoglutarate dehydrogenase complex dihydrolipoamide acyltransferase (E2) component
MDLIGKYEEKPFPRMREMIVDTVEQGLKRRHMKALIELDVTKGREYIRKYKEETGEALSFTGWIMKCIAQTVNEHKHIQAMRKGNKIVIFDDVDISVIVERVVDNRIFPVIFVVRKANKKSLREIHDEIRRAQAQTKDNYMQKREARSANRLLSLPKFLRNFFFWRKIRKDPFFVKKYMGTVMVTSIGMFGKKGQTSWGIATSIQPLDFILGGISRKPGVIRNKIEIREYLCMTILFDRDVVDGAPAARFIARLTELVENTFGLTKMKKMKNLKLK